MSIEPGLDKILERLSKLEKSADEMGSAIRGIAERLSSMERKNNENLEVISGFLRLMAANQLMLLQEAYNPDDFSNLNAPAAKKPAADTTRVSAAAAAGSSVPSAASKYPERLPAASQPFLPLANVLSSKLRVGDRFAFGRYPQGMLGEIKPIYWRVLVLHVDSLLVMAEDCLAYQPYNEAYSYTSWSNCSLRRWLNGEFFNRAFNEWERSRILCRSILNNLEPPTEDRVFLLSEDEARLVLANISERRARPTVFAQVCRGVGRTAGSIPFCDWWLRSVSRSGALSASGSGALYVDGNGFIPTVGTYFYSRTCAVRPAMRIAI